MFRALIERAGDETDAQAVLENRSNHVAASDAAPMHAVAIPGFRNDNDELNGPTSRSHFAGVRSLIESSHLKRFKNLPNVNLPRVHLPCSSAPTLPGKATFVMHSPFPMQLAAVIAWRTSSRKDCLNLARLTDQRQIGAEDLYRICARRGSHRVARPKNRLPIMKTDDEDEEES